jgi:4-diphosphocytidyl-2-C-methyl-D-erythritol kinase
MSGAGEHVDVLPAPAPFGLVIVPSGHALSTPAVYAAFDRLGGARAPGELEQRAAAARAGEPPPPVNDLQAAARALCPPIDAVLADVAAAGAHTAMVSGSGPTVFGLFDDVATARTAAGALAPRHPGAVAAEPAGTDYAKVRAE